MIRFQLDPEKIVNALSLVATRCPRATKMKVCKLLYFADKEHLLQYGRPITGDTYVRMTYGPTPSTGLNLMRGMAASRLTAMFQGKIAIHGNEVRPLTSPDLRVFSRSDLRVLEEISERYGKYNAAQLSKLSHQEAAWIKTPANGLIDFELMFEGRPDAAMTLRLLKEEYERDQPSPRRRAARKTTLVATKT
jgi:uncharacterized phage-associated protein